MMKGIKIILIMSLVFACSFCKTDEKEKTGIKNFHHLVFNEIPGRWDEAIPLGNGMLGALVWQKNDKLRISLDRADLWDLRPVKEFESEDFRFDFVYKHYLERNYKPIAQLIDEPYSNTPGPTKIPAGAMEFDIKELGKPAIIRLDIEKALCEIEWESGARFVLFIHATEPVGWYRFENIREQKGPAVLAPAYRQPAEEEELDSHSGDDLIRLAYPEPLIKKEKNAITYTQEGWDDFNFCVQTNWVSEDEGLTGLWTINSSDKPGLSEEFAKKQIKLSLEKSFENQFNFHQKWWEKYWTKAWIDVPDSLIEKQWYLEMYKFGAASRRGAPPISLQAVWTADNGKRPPWRGDFHNDLNTQLSYWPAYAGNRLDEGLAFIDWLCLTKGENKKFTKQYFGLDGLAVPGVESLTGKPMGGWGQYSLSSTTAAWLAHHFYLHWKYSMDQDFLKEKAYPYLEEVGIFIREIAIKNEQGMNKLPLSSSPEINDNRLEAWFPETTNYDLSLIRWLYSSLTEMAYHLGRSEQALEWDRQLKAWPELARDAENSKLLVAPDYPLPYSHRHFSHLMAIHPLGIVDVSNGAEDQQTISSSLRELEEKGSDYWTGYSFSWLGNLYARAKQGEKAAQSLQTFASCFCLPNSFHVNGDQSGTGKSKFTYRPFTLEGNFAFASAVMEMLIQSHAGQIELFPAIPADWGNCEFADLRSYGAFLISAKMENKKIAYIKIESTKGGECRLKLPNSEQYVISGIEEEHIQKNKEFIICNTFAGQIINLELKK